MVKKTTISSQNKNQKVAILDAGAQYAKVIDRRIRELGVESELLPLNTPAKQLAKYAAIIISGGPQSVYAASAPKYDPELFALTQPMLGICYGMQLMAYVEGGKVGPQNIREDGQCAATLNVQSKLFTGLSADQMVLMSHGDSILELPKKYQATGRTSGQIVTSMENRVAKRYAVQFHPEVDLTEHGKEILANFLFRVVGLKPTFTVENREQKAIELIQQKVGKQQVLMLVSGGVDSTVCAALLRKALPPEQILAIHINNGLMRENESELVATALQKIGLSLTVVDATDDFLQPLKNLTDPQAKRQTIGDTFVAVAEKYLQSLQLNLATVFLCQGTLRPDLIESASSHITQSASAIKTHHNDTALVRELRAKGRVIEPLAEYHKDEVRQLGKQLGLSEELIWRQPFPGPGLGVRILCAIAPYLTADYSEVLTNLQQLVPSTLSVTLLPIRAVGVQGDGRTYSYVAALSSATAPNWPELMALAADLPKKVHQINRVAFVFGAPVSQPIHTITPTLLTAESVTQLRKADGIVNAALLKYGLTKSISQVPVVLIPIDFDGQSKKRSVVIRTFMTNDFMTGSPAVPGKEMPLSVLTNMVKTLLEKTPHISRVLYDLTAKPPGTTEWE
jgi:GMP synthase (glutamine-hydrolysing)